MTCASLLSLSPTFISVCLGGGKKGTRCVECVCSSCSVALAYPHHTLTIAPSYLQMRGMRAAGRDGLPDAADCAALPGMYVRDVDGRTRMLCWKERRMSSLIGWTPHPFYPHTRAVTQSPQTTSTQQAPAFFHVTPTEPTTTTECTDSPTPTNPAAGSRHRACSGGGGAGAKVGAHYYHPRFQRGCWRRNVRAPLAARTTNAWRSVPACVFTLCSCFLSPSHTHAVHTTNPKQPN